MHWPTLILIFLACQSQMGSGEEPSALELVKLYCHSENDDPESPEYLACSRGIDLLEKELEGGLTDPSTATVLLQALRNRSPERGRALARRILELDPDNAEAHLFLGTYAESPDDQLVHLRRAAELAPENPFVHGQLAWRLLEKDDPGAAVAEMERQIAVAPDAYGGLLPRFLRELEQRNLVEERKKLLLSYLGSDIPVAERCRWFEALDAAAREGFEEVDELVKATCGVDGDRDAKR